MTVGNVLRKMKKQRQGERRTFRFCGKISREGQNVQFILQQGYLRILGNLAKICLYFVINDVEMQKKQGVLVMGWEVKLLLRKKNIPTCYIL